MTENNGLPPGWDWVPLGEIVENVIKVQPKENPEEEFIYLDISSIDNEQSKIISPKHYLGKDAPSRARQLVKTGDILFSTVRTYLKNIAQVPPIYDGQIASTGFCVIRASSKLDKQYCFYLTLSNQFIDSLSKIQRGTSYPAVRNSDVFEQFIPLPPLPEQERIVAKIEELFTQLDAGVAELEQAKAQLKRYRQSVLKSAVEGELTREWRESRQGELEPASQLLERVLAERREKWVGKGKYKESSAPDVKDLPDLPEGWVWATMDALADVIGGVTKGRHLEKHKTILAPYLRVANVQQGYLDLDLIKEIEIREDELEKYRLRSNDLLLTEGGDWDKLGRSAIWHNQVSDCVHQNHIFRARPFTEDISTTWLMYWTNSLHGRKYFANSSKQTALVHK